MKIASGERALMVSMGRRSLIIGLVMLAIGVAVLGARPEWRHGLLVAVGLLAGGVIEIVRGATKLSG